MERQRLGKRKEKKRKDEEKKKKKKEKPKKKYHQHKQKHLQRSSKDKQKCCSSSKNQTAQMALELGHRQEAARQQDITFTAEMSTMQQLHQQTAQALKAINDDMAHQQQAVVSLQQQQQSSTPQPAASPANVGAATTDELRNQLNDEALTYDVKQGIKRIMKEVEESCKGFHKTKKLKENIEKEEKGWRENKTPNDSRPFKVSFESPQLEDKIHTEQQFTIKFERATTYRQRMNKLHSHYMEHLKKTEAEVCQARMVKLEEQCSYETFTKRVKAEIIDQNTKDYDTYLPGANKKFFNNNNDLLETTKMHLFKT